jgi:Na+-driven multidrug efflux pump
MCITSVTALVIGPVTDNLRPATEHLRRTWAHCKTFSRDLLIANQVRWFGFQGVLLVGTAIVGTAAIGGLRAAQNLSGPVYLFLIAIENVVPIRIAEELKRKGTAEAYAFTQRAIWGGVAIFGSIVLPIGIFGRQLLHLLYGPAMIAYYLPMVLQLVSIVVQAAISMWLYFYRGLQDTRALLQVNVTYAIVNIATVYWFGRLWQAPGIVLSSLLAQLIAIAYCINYWTRHSKELLLRHQSETDVAIHKSSNEYGGTNLLSDGGAE